MWKGRRKAKYMDDIRRSGKSRKKRKKKTDKQRGTVKVKGDDNL